MREKLNKTIASCHRFKVDIAISSYRLESIAIREYIYTHENEQRWLVGQGIHYEGVYMLSEESGLRPLHLFKA